MGNLSMVVLSHLFSPREIGKLVKGVILSEAKNLMVSTESTIEILRLSPQNGITTQSPDGKVRVRGNTVRQAEEGNYG